MMQNSVKITQPPIVTPQEVAMPHATVVTLANGVKLYTMSNSDKEVVRVTFVFGAGSSMQRVPFSASTTLNLLAEGTQKYSSLQIAEQLDFHGSYFDVNIDRDYSIITFCSLKKFLSPTLDVAEQVILHPTFPQHEIETYINKRKHNLELERSKVSYKARELFGQTLWGVNHPYGVASAASDYDTLTIEDIKTFYEEHYNAQNCFVVSSGDVDQSVVDQLKTLCEKIPQGTKQTREKFPEPQTSPTAFGEHIGAVQSAIRVGTMLFGRTHPDFIAMQVASTVLGGYFGSRLVHNLREERGYTYGVFSAMVNLDHGGYMAVATEVGVAVTDDAIEQIYHEIELLRTTLVGEQELQMVKNIVVGEVMRVMDGPFGVADVAIENIQNGNDNNYINDFIREVKGITPERLLEVCQKYFVREKFITVVVGGASRQT